MDSNHKLTFIQIVAKCVVMVEELGFHPSEPCHKHQTYSILRSFKFWSD